MSPERGETAASARDRGVAVPDDVPDDANYQVLNGGTLETPGWVWQRTKPFVMSQAGMKVLAGEFQYLHMRMPK